MDLGSQPVITFHLPAPSCHQAPSCHEAHFTSRARLVMTAVMAAVAMTGRMFPHPRSILGSRTRTRPRKGRDEGSWRLWLRFAMIALWSARYECQRWWKRAMYGGICPEEGCR